MYRTLRNFPGYLVYKERQCKENCLQIYSLKTSRFLKPGFDKDGYPILSPIDKDGKKTMCKQHRLVALAWKKNPKQKPICHHKDHDKRNSDADNVAWTTQQENVIFYHKHKKAVNS
jgi:hypothetical protein